MGIFAPSSKLLNGLQACSRKCFEGFYQPKSDTANSLTELKGKSKDDLLIVEKSERIENSNFSRIKCWYLTTSRGYHNMMQNKLLMFCVVGCFFLCMIQFLFFIIYWADIVPRNTQKAIDNLNYDYLTAYLKKKCVPYGKILDQCIL
ncbi:YGL230C [Saccharomyces arboricola H-6]|uniref:YGL230C n=1 Tax=Saccharomyces arboricola (strain H-6 / AS 2.3317 / CBS 10644) TaxID=1160507 RepID=J8Q5F5_SACAR|nr:YGL230C [Saccharomyces arboricola H-6]